MESKLREQAILDARRATRQLNDHVRRLLLEAQEPDERGKEASKALRTIADAIEGLLCDVVTSRRGTDEPQHEVRGRLLRVAGGLDSRILFPSVSPEATDFALGDPFAFLLACSLDRGAASTVIWSIPYWLHERLGKLDSATLARMSEEEIRAALLSLTSRPRYMHAAPRTIQQLSRMVADELGGDATRLWRERSANDVKRRLMTISGIGPGLADLTVMLIEKAFGYTFPDPENIDIKPDTHTKKVLRRLGLIAEEKDQEAVAAARALMPESPGRLDMALWHIGREWCHLSRPSCGTCPMDGVCLRVGLG